MRQQLRDLFDGCCGIKGWLAAAIIILYYVVVWLFSRNAPFDDDYVIVRFVARMLDPSNAGSVIDILFEQHNEHRIVTAKAIFAIDRWLFGELNFRRLIFVGNLSLLGVFYMFVKQGPQEVPLRCYFAVVAACMVFQFSSAESMLWAIAALSHYVVLLLTLLALSLATKAGLGYLALANLTSFAAAFTQGNGLLVPLVTAACLVNQKRYRAGALTGMTWVLALLVNFSGYVVPVKHANPLELARDLGRLFVFALSFTGSAFGIGGSHYPVLSNISLVSTVAVGSLIWTLTIYGICRKSTSHVFIWFNVFVALTATLTAMSRINFGLSQALVSRYHTYSSLAVLSTIAMMLQYYAPLFSHGNWKAIYTTGSVLAVAYFLVSFAFVPYFYFVVFAP